MASTHPIHEHELPADAALQAAIALDAALDRLTTPATPSPENEHPSAESRNGHPPNEHAQPLLETAQYLSRLNAAQPDKQFAATLRDSLLKSVSIPPPPASSAPVPASLGIQPALPPMYRTQFRPTPRLAAMLVAVVCLIGALLGGDNLANRVMDVVDRDPTPRQINDIPIFRNDPAGAAAQPGPAPTGPVSIQWSFRTGASLTGSPVIADGILYVGSANHHLYALDAVSGIERWSFDAGGTVRGPAVVDGVVYIVTGATDLIAIDAKSGVERWRVEFTASDARPPTVVDSVVYLSTGVMGSNNPAVHDGVVYSGGGPPGTFSSSRSVLYAFDADTGQERWRLDTSGDLALYAVDAATGQIRWRTAVEGPPWGEPIVANGRVYVPTGKNGPLVAMDASTGQPIGNLIEHSSTPVLVDGTLYSGTVALDPATGQERWRNDALGHVQAAPAVVGDTAFLMTERGTLYAIDATSGIERWHSVIGLHIVYALSPIVTGGMIYVAASDGALYALGEQSDDTHVAALPRDVPNPVDCVVTPVDPATVADVQPTEPQAFVWPIGSPADDATVAEVSTAFRDLVACLNAGDPRRIYPLYTNRFWQVSTSRGGTPPDVFLAGETAPLGVEERVAIRSISDVEILPDGRIGVRTITDSRGDLPPQAVTSYLIFAQVDGHWLVDESVPISQSTEIPPVSLVAPNSATPSVVQSTTDCTIEPPDLPSLAATVNASRDSSQTPIPTPTTVPLTGDTPANEVVTNDVYATVREWVACANAGESTRFMGLYTPELRVRMFTPLASDFEWSPDPDTGPATPRPASEQSTIRTLSPVGLLPDGRAFVTVELDVPYPPEGPPAITFILIDTGERWLIDDIIVAAPDPDATPPVSITAPTNINLRSSATFSATVFEVAVAGSPLYPAGPGEFIEGILWLPVEGYDNDSPFFVPAVYLTAGGARIPGVPVLTDSGIGIPSPSECQVEPMPLADIAAYMGPSPSGTVSQRSAMTYLATGVGFNETESLGARDRSDIERAVMTTLREAIACQNAGSFTQNVALYTQDYFQHSGAESFRPDGSESQLATPQPLPTENRTEILEIGDLALLDDGRVGVIVITADHAEPTQVTAAYVILAETGDRWRIDDAIPIDASVSPGGYLIPAAPLDPTPTPTATEVSTGTGVLVEDYFAVETSTPTVATPTEPSSQAIAQPMFPVGATVAVRGTTINLHSLPRSNAEVIARLGPCACAMQVFGPMADSGDAVWLPVTDLDTGVSGYVSLEFVLPPEFNQLGSLRIGQTFVTTGPVRLRDVPESSATAGEPLPAGTSLAIEATTISAGHSWIMVGDPINGGVGWIAHDILVAATTSDAPPATPTPASHVQSPDFAVGQRVTVTSDGVNLREAPFTDSFIVDILREGTQLEITGAPEEVDDAIWYPSRDTTSGEDGYVSSYFLAIASPLDATPTPTQSSTSSTSAYGPGFQQGQIVVTTSDDVNFRESPSFDADIIDQLNEGHELEITGPSIAFDSVTWYPVRDPEGMEGFIVAEFLASSDSAPPSTRTPTPTPTAQPR